MNMETTTTNHLSEFLRGRMQVLGLSEAELARQAEIPQPTLHRILSGSTKSPRGQSLQKLANFFDVSINQMLEDVPRTDPRALTTNALNNILPHMVPLIPWGQIHTWDGADSFQDWDELIAADNNISRNAFATKMQGSSFEPQFPEHSILIIDPEKVIYHRCYVFVCNSSQKEAIFRQLLVDGKDYYLKALDPELANLGLRKLGENERIVGVLSQVKISFPNN